MVGLQKQDGQALFGVYTNPEFNFECERLIVFISVLRLCSLLPLHTRPSMSKARDIHHESALKYIYRAFSARVRGQWLPSRTNMSGCVRRSVDLSNFLFVSLYA